MKVILMQDIEKLGKSGDLVQTKDGYARNYLFPRGLAVLATPAALHQLAIRKKIQEQQLEKDKKEALALASQLNGISVNLAVEVHEEDQLYGSITSAEIARALEGEGIKIDKKMIILKNPIKTLGIFDLVIKLHPEVEAQIKLWVVKK